MICIYAAMQGLHSIMYTAHALQSHDISSVTEIAKVIFGIFQLINSDSVENTFSNINPGPCVFSYTTTK